MDKDNTSKLLRWAEDEKGHSISAGALTLNEVVAIAINQEAHAANAEKLPSPKLDNVANSLPLSVMNSPTAKD